MQDINNGIVKTVRSLTMKKNRDEEGLFVAEGMKCVRDTWGNFKCRWLIATRAWYDQFGNSSMIDSIVFATKAQMAKISQFSTASDVLAVYEIPPTKIDNQRVASQLNIVLDNVQDPGNLGTIIRLADWYGIKDIFATIGTVDVYNHKVVQATMGAISRVSVHYCDVEQMLLSDFPNMPVYGTFLDGENIYGKTLEQKGFVIFGNEGQGIGKKLAKTVNERLLIPAWPHDGTTSESLNVGVAAAITISEFRRNALAK